MREIIDAIVEERWRQDGKWGGPAHDDQHDYGDWQAFIIEHAKKMMKYGPDEFEVEAVKIAALAIAAIQSSRRKHVSKTRNA
jgi:hypothetical protein